ETFAAIGLVLLAIELALAWWQFAVRTLRARLALALRLAMGALLVLALLGAGVPQIVDRQATIFVADISASVRDARPLASDFIVQALGAKRADDAYAVVETARSSSVTQVLSSTPRPELLPADDALSPRSDATDLAAGLRLGADLLPAGYRPREV